MLLALNLFPLPLHQKCSNLLYRGTNRDLGHGVPWEELQGGCRALTVSYPGGGSLSEWAEYFCSQRQRTGALLGRRRGGGRALLQPRGSGLSAQGINCLRCVPHGSAGGAVPGQAHLATAGHIAEGHQVNLPVV